MTFARYLPDTYETELGLTADIYKAAITSLEVEATHTRLTDLPSCQHIMEDILFIELQT